MIKYILDFGTGNFSHLNLRIYFNNWWIGTGMFYMQTRSNLII